MIAANSKPEAIETGLAGAKSFLPPSVVGGMFGLIVTGDWLFWDHGIGISWAVFLVLLVAVQAVLHARTSSRRAIALGLAIALLSIAPVVEDLNMLSILLSTFGAFTGCLVMSNSLSKDSGLWITEVFSRLVVAPSRFPLAVVQYSKSRDSPSNLARLGVWFFPALLALVFVLLFTEASPVWRSWWEALDFSNILALIFSPRWLFWIALAWFSFPFLSSRLSNRFRSKSFLKRFGASFENGVVERKTAEKHGGVQFFIRCLILFNLVFAVQTLLDLQYLWGGAELPDGMTYAQYAHRGAYPLMAAALLAALFVLIATRPGGAGEKSQLVKWLVIGWVAQNLMLVFSSVERLNLYVAVYTLTYWRIAAFIWMGLVAIGLVLIVVRFATGKSSHWLFASNFIALVLVLYVTSFVNLPNLIASYNLEHSKLVKKQGIRIDWSYIWRLGPNAYPAIAKFNATHYGEIDSEADRKELRKLQVKRGRYFPNFPEQNWRDWSFRQQRAYWVWKRFGNRPVFDKVREVAAP